jgi:5'-nucleotidase
MVFSSFTNVLGFAAATLTTASFVPQVLKIRKQGGRDLSYPMLVVFWAGVMLWLVYGVLMKAPAIIVANMVTGFLVLLAIFLKAAVKKSAPVSTRAQRPRLRIAIDMDEVMADSLSRHIELYNDEFGANLRKQDLQGKPLHLTVPEAHRRRIDEIALSDGFFWDLDVMPGCQEVIRELMERYDIFIVTAAMEFPNSFLPKHAWLQEHFPFLDIRNVVYCGDKSIVDADIMIDDRIRNLEQFQGMRILFSAPHNLNEKRFLRVNSWKEVRALLLGDGAHVDHQHRDVLTLARASRASV